MLYLSSSSKRKSSKSETSASICNFNGVSASYALLLAGLFAAAISCFGQARQESSSAFLASGDVASREALGIGTSSAETSSAQTSSDGPPQAVTLQDAIARAQKIYSQYLATVTDAQVAREDFRQARNAMLPSIGYTQQYLGTQGNGRTPNGRYVTNDGVHVYRAWGVFHQDFPPGFFSAASYKRAAASAALADAKAEIARRGIVVTVTKAFYTLIAAERKYASAQQTVSQAQRFLDDTRNLERGGEVAHADVVKAQLQLDQQKVALREAELAMNNAHLALTVLLSPTFDQNFTAVDDMEHAPVLPGLQEVKNLAERENQDIRAALQTLRQAKADVTIARAGFFPTLTFDADYGIEANAFALHSRAAGFPEAGVLPNLGYFVTASLNMPIWNWGTTRSRLKQAQYRHRQAAVDLSQTQREALSNLYSFYNEATAAQSETQTLREAADLAAESLRLTTLRYQAGEATALEIVDAQNALATARNAFDDGQARYWVALAALQTLTGRF
jgi:outer membrane protein TolC